MFRGFLEHKVRKLSLRGDVSRMGLYENYVKIFFKKWLIREILSVKSVTFAAENEMTERILIVFRFRRINKVKVLWNFFMTCSSETAHFGVAE